MYKAFNEMTDTAVKEFLFRLDRSELYENYRIYSKGVRVTLISLGYNEEWVNGKFRDIMESYYHDDLEDCIF